MATAMASSGVSTADPSPTMATSITAPISNHIPTISSTSTLPSRPSASAPPQSQNAARPQLIQNHHQPRSQHHLQPPIHHSNNQQHFFTGAAQNPIQIHTTVVYPLASSGRGLLQTPHRSQFPEQRVTVANPGAYPVTARPIANSCPPPPFQPQIQHARMFVSSDSHQRPNSGYAIRAPYLHPPNPNIARGISSVSTPFFTPDGNNNEDPNHKVKGDVFVTVRDRKVRISSGTSLYALCRSWLRNGYLEESQQQYGDFMKSLPKPSPMPVSESSPLKRKQSDQEAEIEEDEKSIENLSAKELLQGHIKRAKRVRARLRDERMQRIGRYKSRLALLLPPVAEQCGNDTGTAT